MNTEIDNIIRMPIQDQREPIIELVNHVFNYIDTYIEQSRDEHSHVQELKSDLESQFRKIQFLKSELKKVNSKKSFQKSDFEKVNSKNTKIEKIRQFMLDGKRTRKEVVIELLVMNGYNREEVTENYTKGSYFAFYSTNITKWYGLGTVENVNGYMRVTKIGKRAISLYTIDPKDELKKWKRYHANLSETCRELRWENIELKRKLEQINSVSNL